VEGSVRSTSTAEPTTTHGSGGALPGHRLFRLSTKSGIEKRVTPSVSNGRHLLRRTNELLLVGNATAFGTDKLWLIYIDDVLSEVFLEQLL
jgi:hypothetical protein